MTAPTSPSRDDQQEMRERAWSSVAVLQPVPPFDFGQSLAFLTEFPPTRGEQSTGGTLVKAFLFDGQPVAVRATGSGSVERPELAIDARADSPLTPGLRTAIVDRIGFYLSLTDDLRPFYEIGQQDASFAPVIRLLHGYHQVKFPTPFEAVSWAVLTQRTPITTAQRAKQALAEAFGQSITIDRHVYWPFPEPAALATVSAVGIAAVVQHERKAAYLHAAATAFTAVDESFLRYSPFDDVRDWLRGISGVGPWSAAFTLLRGLGRMEEVPTEAMLEQAITRRYGPLAPAGRAALTEQYGPWQGYWAHYLRVADDRQSLPDDGR